MFWHSVAILSNCKHKALLFNFQSIRWMHPFLQKFRSKRPLVLLFYISRAVPDTYPATAGVQFLFFSLFINRSPIIAIIGKPAAKIAIIYRIMESFTQRRWILVQVFLYIVYDLVNDLKLFINFCIIRKLAVKWVELETARENVLLVHWLDIFHHFCSLFAIFFNKEVLKTIIKTAICLKSVEKIFTSIKGCLNVFFDLFFIDALISNSSCFFFFFRDALDFLYMNRECWAWTF